MTRSARERPARAPVRWPPGILVTAGLVLAAVIRLGHWWAVRALPFVGELVMDSQEYDRWARVLAGGGWFGREAFFQAPFYPYLVGALYSVAGARPAVVYLAQIAVAVGALWALGRTARHLAGPAGAEPEAARLEAAVVFLGALCGPLVFHDVQLLKESFAASVVSFLLLALVRARETGTVSRWLVAGVFLGVLSELRENALLLAPLLVLLVWSGRSEEGPRRPALARFATQLVVKGGTFAAGVLLVLAPFAIRNWLVEGELLVTTYQGGVNFYIGNNPEADGTYRPLTPGRQVPRLERREPVRIAEAEVGHQLAPGEVSRFWLGKSLDWARREPLAFVRLQLRKLGLFWSFYEWPDAVDYYWMAERSPALRLAFVELGSLALLAAAGLWLVRGRLGRWLPVLLFVAGWTVATVVFFVFSRYRLPMIPALILLAGVPVARVGERWADGRRRAAALGAFGVCAALAVPHLLGYGPRLDLVHYNLGRLAEQRGEPEEAARQYRAALEANPKDFLSLMSLGTLAGRRGEPAAAVPFYERAVAIEPGSPEVWTNLGAALLAAGRLEEAGRALEQAVALDGSDARALHDLSLVRAAQGRLEEAARLNRRVLELSPGLPAALRLRDRLADRGEDGG